MRVAEELAAAAAEMLKLGRHEWQCQPWIGCHSCERTLQERADRLRVALNNYRSCTRPESVDD
jgi:hypothetical protein